MSNHIDTNLLREALALTTVERWASNWIDDLPMVSPLPVYAGRIIELLTMRFDAKIYHYEFRRRENHDTPSGPHPVLVRSRRTIIECCGVVGIAYDLDNEALFEWIIAARAALSVEDAA